MNLNHIVIFSLQQELKVRWLWSLGLGLGVGQIASLNLNLWRTAAWCLSNRGVLYSKPSQMVTIKFVIWQKRLSQYKHRFSSTWIPIDLNFGISYMEKTCKSAYTLNGSSSG